MKRKVRGSLKRKQRFLSYFRRKSEKKNKTISCKCLDIEKRERTRMGKMQATKKRREKEKHLVFRK